MHKTLLSWQWQSDKVQCTAWIFLVMSTPVNCFTVSGRLPMISRTLEKKNTFSLKSWLNINVWTRLQIKFFSNWKCLVEYSPLLWVCSPQQDHPRWTPLSPTCGSIKCHLHVFQLNVSIIQNFWWYFEGNLLCLSKWCSNFGGNLELNLKCCTYLSGNLEIKFKFKLIDWSKFKCCSNFSGALGFKF